MGSLDPHVRVVDKVVLTGLVTIIEDILSQLPQNVTEVTFVESVPTHVEHERGGYWAVDHNFDYKDQLEEMARDARLGEPGSVAALRPIWLIYIYQVSEGTISIHLNLSRS